MKLLKIGTDTIFIYTTQLRIVKARGPSENN